MKKAQINKNTNEYAKPALLYLCDPCLCDLLTINLIFCCVFLFNLSEVLYHYLLYHVIGFQSFIHVVTKNLSQKEALSIKRGSILFTNVRKVCVNTWIENKQYKSYVLFLF